MLIILYCIEHLFTVQDDAKRMLKLLHHHKLHTTVNAKPRRPWVWGPSSSTGVPSLIFWSSSSKVGSMSSQPSGGGFRLLFTLGIFLCFVQKRTKAHGVFVVICEPGLRRYNMTYFCCGGPFHPLVSRPTSPPQINILRWLAFNNILYLFRTKTLHTFIKTLIQVSLKMFSEVT